MPKNKPVQIDISDADVRIIVGYAAAAADRTNQQEPAIKQHLKELNSAGVFTAVKTLKNNLALSQHQEMGSLISELSSIAALNKEIDNEIKKREQNLNDINEAASLVSNATSKNIQEKVIENDALGLSGEEPEPERPR